MSKLYSMSEGVSAKVKKERQRDQGKRCVGGESGLQL